MKKSNPDYILSACKFDGKGGCKDLVGNDISKEIKSKNLAWVHLDGNSEQTKTWLEKEISYLDDIIIEALLAEETRPRTIEFNNGAVIILRGANLNEGEDYENMVSLRLWVDESRIISIRRTPLKTAKHVYNSLKKGNGPKSSGEFIAQVTANLFDRIDPIFDEIESKIDHAEQQVMEKPNATLRNSIVEIRKETMIFKRYISPQREVVNSLINSNFKWLDETDKRKLREVYNQVWRFIEELDSLRERAQIVKDELTNSLSDKLNRNLYFLSVISAIFLPLGFFTGLLGINVGGIPGTENPDAFLIFCAMLATIVFLQVILFKILKWF